MVTQHTSSVVPADFIERKIYVIRGRKVMLDSDLAELYQVDTKVLNQAIKRNSERFPNDFMFQLTQEEVRNLISQSVISSSRLQIATLNKSQSKASRSQSVTLKRGENIKYLPYAFTEHGVAMLSSVLRSQRAVQMNISIIRAFIAMRGTLTILEAGEEIEMIKADQREHWKQIVSLRDIVVQIINPVEKGI